MSLDNEFNAMTEACLEAAQHIKRCGSPELQVAMRVLLFILAGETIERAERRSADASRQSNDDGEQ